MDHQQQIELPKSASTAESISGYWSLQAAPLLLAIALCTWPSEAAAAAVCSKHGICSASPCRVQPPCAASRNRRPWAAHAPAAREFCGIFGRQEIGNGRQELGHLHQRTLELAERLPAEFRFLAKIGLARHHASRRKPCPALPSPVPTLA